MNKAVQDALKHLENKSSGLLTKEQVVTAARSPSNPLHKEFNWNVNEAAQERWLIRAEELIRDYKLVVQVHETTRRIKGFMRTGNGTGFLSIKYAKANHRKTAETVINSLLLDMNHALGTLINIRNKMEYLSSTNPYMAEALEKLEENVENITDIISLIERALKAPAPAGKKKAPNDRAVVTT